MILNVPIFTSDEKWISWPVTFCSNSRLLQVEATEALGMKVKQTVMVVMHTFPRIFNWHHLFFEAFDESNFNNNSVSGFHLIPVLYPFRFCLQMDKMILTWPGHIYIIWKNCIWSQAGLLDTYLFSDFTCEQSTYYKMQIFKKYIAVKSIIVSINTLPKSWIEFVQGSSFYKYNWCWYRYFAV